VRVAPGEQNRRIMVATDVARRATDQGRLATVGEVATALGLSYNASKKLLDAAFQILASGTAAETIPRVQEGTMPGAAPKKKTGRPKKDPPIVPRPPDRGNALVTVEVITGGMSMLPDPRDTRDPFAHTRSFEADGDGPLRSAPLDMPAHLKANMAQLYTLMQRVESDLQIMRHWVFGATPTGTEPGHDHMPGMCEACGREYTRRFPLRPSSMFGPVGTSNDVAALARTFTDVIAKITKQIQTHGDVQAQYYNQQGLAQFMEACYLAIDDVAPDDMTKIAERLRYYQLRQQRGLPLR
jgi:hypothetical protein